MFSVVYGVLIQLLPYPESNALVGVYNSLTIQGQTFKNTDLSPGMYVACLKGCRAFENFGVWSSGAATVTGAGEPEQVTTVTMTQVRAPHSGRANIARPMVLGGRRHAWLCGNSDPEPRLLAKEVWARPRGYSVELW